MDKKNEKKELTVEDWKGRALLAEAALKGAEDKIEKLVVENGKYRELLISHLEQFAGLTTKLKRTAFEILGE